MGLPRPAGPMASGRFLDPTSRPSLLPPHSLETDRRPRPTLAAWPPRLTWKLCWNGWYITGMTLILKHGES